MRTRYDELREEVQAFHDEHPRVWELFKQFTMNRVQLGFTHYSAYAIFERIRWETDQANTPENQFKLNNNYRPFYARKFMATYPEYEGFFRVRKQTSKDKAATGMRPLTPQDF
jgi:hypothetical protein